MKVSIAGDFCQKNRVDIAIKEKRYGDLFDNIKPIVEATDYSIVNFEFPIVTNSKKAKPVPKCGPNLLGSIESIDAVKYAGFNCCTLANNHTLDQGGKCGIETQNLLENAGIDTVGFGENLDKAGIILYKKIAGETLAIVNCCEHEFSVATENSAGTMPLDATLQYYQIIEAKRNADFVLLIVHGGHEYYQLPSTRMKRLYQFFIDAGADAVVNHHQHCYSGYEIYKGKPIYYGLGNLCFDEPQKRKTTWNEGYMVCLDFKASKIDFDIIPYTQCGDSVGVFLMKDEEIEKFHKKLEELNSIISDISKLQTSEKEYYEANYKSTVFMFEPYENRMLDKLFDLKLLPSTISQKRILRILNYVMCESHRDKLITAIKAYIENK